MEALLGRPRILPALLALIVAGLVPVGIAYQRGILDLRVRQRLASDARAEQLSEEQRQRMLEQSERFGPYLVAAGAVGGPIAGLLAASGIFYGLLLVWSKAHPSFRAVCAVVAHAWLPLALYSLLSVPILLAKDPREVDLDNVITLANPAFLVAAAEQPKLYRVAGSLDLFSFWIIGLLALGLGRLAGRPAWRILPVVVGPWVLYIVVFKALLA